MNKLIEQLGWKEVEDRGMAENYGHLFRLDEWELRYWRAYPRFMILKHENVYGSEGEFRGDCTRVYESGIQEECIGIADIKQVMIKENIPML